ncbi:hypothetical protein [Kitasatospora fiedleri]|uniref:hypothetical protein n=1 Tax=Kitasatospora fiedleri TaxID=2991545 RepID=UPI00249BAEAF|nr:hypothetical protein [Kitasatospora fiedleri]
MELVDEEDGDGLAPSVVRVNGTDVGALARAPKVTVAGNGATTVTLVLMPRRVDIRHKIVPTVGPRRQPFGFRAGNP